MVAYLFVFNWVPLMNEIYTETLAKARRRDQVDPSECKQALLERGGFRFPLKGAQDAQGVPNDVWGIIVGYMKVILKKPTICFSLKWSDSLHLQNYRHLMDSSRLKELVLYFSKTLCRLSQL